MGDQTKSLDLIGFVGGDVQPPIPKKKKKRGLGEAKKTIQTRMEAIMDKQDALDGVKVLWNNMFQADLSII